MHVHLEAGPDGVVQLMTHLGLPLPDHQRRLILCDVALRGVLHEGLAPLGAGRKTRNINRRLRRAIEHRDGGCRVPGCDATHGLEIHHIWHWEDGGPTESWNLITLCSRHHRMHHLGELTVEGNPDLMPGIEGGIEFRDARDRRLDACGTPIPRIVDAARRPATTTPGQVAHEAARAAGLEPVRYEPPTGERLDMAYVHFSASKVPPPAEMRTDEESPPDDGSPSTPGLQRPRSHARPRQTEPAGRPDAHGPPATDAA